MSPQLLGFVKPMEHLISEFVEYMLWIDALAVEVMLELRNPVMTNVMNSVTGLGSVAAGLVFLGLFYLAGWRDEFGVALVALAISGLVVALLMAVVQRPFPPQPVCVTDGAGTPTTSFPSGHAAAVTVFALVARASDRLPFKTITVIAAMIAISRMYLGVHYLSDTVAGIVLGIVAVLLAERVVAQIDPYTMVPEFRLPGDR